MSGLAWVMNNRNAGFPVLVAVAVVALSACSAGPELRVEQAPQQATAFESLTVLEVDSDAQAAKAVTRILQEHHGVQAGDDWLLLVTLALRPVGVGSFSDPDGRDGVWTETPRIVGARRGPGLHVLTVVATRKDGEASRVARVSARGPLEGTPDELMQLLADAAATLLVEGGLAL